MFRMFLVSAVCFSAMAATTAKALDPPSDRVVAMYFHRTERCPTCKMMGSYTEEAMKSGFASQLNKGTVQLRFIDFQKPENEKLAKAYKVTSPSLIVAKVEDNRVSKYTDLKEIWVKVREKEQFVKYVQENVKAYMD